MTVYVQPTKFVFEPMHLEQDEGPEFTQLGIEVTAGYGPCKGCGCRAFKPTGKQNDICADCGHHWQSHRD